MNKMESLVYMQNKQYSKFHVSCSVRYAGITRRMHINYSYDSLGARVEGVMQTHTWLFGSGFGMTHSCKHLLFTLQIKHMTIKR